MRDWMRLLLSLAAPLAVGFIGAAATASGVRDWYPGLAKPPFTPPPWVFGPVWTVLYLMMGAALFLVWRGGLATRAREEAVWAFAVQLILNALWSPAFFGARSPAAGLAVIILLDAAVVVTIPLVSRVSRAGGWLLAPYLLWALFATVLNVEIWRLNRTG